KAQRVCQMVKVQRARFTTFELARINNIVGVERSQIGLGHRADTLQNVISRSRSDASGTVRIRKTFARDDQVISAGKEGGLAGVRQLDKMFVGDALHFFAGSKWI